MVFKEGRHFVLHLMKFVFQILGRHLPPDMQKLLGEFPLEEESTFTVNITKAIMIFVNEYLDFGGDLVDISSREFPEILNSVSIHENFLEFLGYYAVKCVAESKDQPDSPAIFLTSITNYLERIKNLDVCICDYWEGLDKAAARIVVRDIEIYKGNCQLLRDPYFEVDIVLEKEFIIDVMNYIFDLFEAPDEIKLKHEVRSQYSLSPNIEEALQITVNHHAQRYSLLRDYEPMSHHFRNVSKTGFNEEDFLEFCVCCTRQAVLEYTRDNNIEAPTNARDHLVKTLQVAKENGKFTSLDKMGEAAKKLIMINAERIKHHHDRTIVTCLKRKLESIEDSGVPEEKSKKDCR